MRIAVGARLVAGLSLLLLSSCLEVEQSVVLHADGSGSQHLRLLASPAGLQALAGYLAGMPGAKGREIDHLFEPKFVRQEIEAAGLTCVTATSREHGRRKELETTADFATLAGLARSPLGGGTSEWHLTAGPRAGTVRLVVFARGEAAWREAVDRASAMTGELGATEQAYFDGLRDRIEGLSVEWSLQVPGDVLQCGGGLEQDGPRRVVARTIAADLRSPRDLVLRLAPRYEVVFDGRGCRLPLER